MAVTLRTVAEAAGVSVSTVSRALQGSPQISVATRAMIDETAGRLGYRPNRAASTLRSKRSQLIGLVMSNLVNETFHTIAEVVQRSLAAEGYQLILSTTQADPGTEESLLLTLADHGVDGVIVIGSGQSAATTNDFLARGIAVVNVIRSSRDSAAPTVLAGDRDGAFEATEHLASVGHRRIGYIGGHEGADSGRERYRGYVEALERHGIPVDPRLVVRGPFTQGFGAEAAEELLDRDTGMTALFAANHEAIFGVLPVLMNRGIRIPQDLSLLAYEDMPLLQMWHPPVSVVDTGAQHIGDLAVDLLLHQIRERLIGGDDKAPAASSGSLARTYRVGAQVIHRESVSPPRPPSPTS